MSIKIINLDKISNVHAQLSPIVSIVKIFASTAAIFSTILLSVSFLSILGAPVGINLGSSREILVQYSFLLLLFVGVWQTAVGVIKHNLFALVLAFAVYICASALGVLNLVRNGETVLYLLQNCTAFLGFSLLGVTAQVAILFLFLRAIWVVATNSRETILLASDSPDAKGGSLGAWIELFGAPAVLRYNRQVIPVLLYVLSCIFVSLAFYPVLVAQFVPGFLIGEARSACYAYIAAGYPSQLVNACLGLHIQDALGKPRALVIVFILVLILTVGSRLLAQRIAVKFLNRRVKSDGRRKSLFLRSFTEDAIPLGRMHRNLLTKIIIHSEIPGRTLDFLLAQLLMVHGPVVAFGKPGQILAPFGTSKSYVPHDNWQEIMGKNISESKAIVLCLGQTEGVTWEISKIFQTKSETKTLFLIPPKKGMSSEVGSLVNLVAQQAGVYGSIIEMHLQEIADQEAGALLIGFFFDYSHDQMVAMYAREACWEVYSSAIKAFGNRGSIEFG